jgi:hypothetical protein
MILTVVTQDGKLQGAAVGDVRPPEISKPIDLGYWRAGLMAGPGQTLQVVDVPDKFRGLLADPDGFMAELTALLEQRGLL